MDVYEAAYCQDIIAVDDAAVATYDHYYDPSAFSAEETAANTALIDAINDATAGVDAYNNPGDQSLVVATIDTDTSNDDFDMNSHSFVWNATSATTTTDVGVDFLLDVYTWHGATEAESVVGEVMNAASGAVATLTTAVDSVTNAVVQGIESLIIDAYNLVANLLS